MADQIGFINPNIQRQGAKSRALAAQRNVQNLPDPRTYGAFSGLLQENPYEVANQFSVFDPKRQQVLQAAESTYPIGALLNVAPAMEFFGINKLLGKVPRMVGQEIGAASMGQRPGSLLEQFIPQPAFAVPPAPSMSQAANLTGALRPQVAPVRGQTSKELVRQQKKILSSDEKETFEKLKQKYPDFAKASQFMTGQEVQKVITNEESVKEISKLLDILPSSKEMASMAKAGAPKQGWYRASTQAIIDVFGADDAPRFASLLAALSPQTSVEMNLLNTLNTWKNWTAAGRPTDARAIKEIMGRSVSGTKGEESVLEAWQNNAIRSLSADDPAKVTLSGPKVDSFYRNLADDVYKVTNDAWMANALGVNQNLFSGSPTALQIARGDPGLTPGYIATSARLRQGAQQANMFPSEGQETMWSLAMPLMEGQTSMGLRAREILDKGLLTPELIRGTPDFSTLLNQGNYQNILSEAGYGQQLANLKPYQWQPSNIQLSLSEQRDIDALARRLEDLQGLRQMESRGKVFSLPKAPGDLKTAFAAEPYEMIPGRGTGFMEELIDLPQGSRANFSSRAASAFQDIQGRDILQGALGLQPIKTRGMQGAYQPPGGIPFAGPRSETGLKAPTLAPYPLETQPGFVSLSEFPVTAPVRNPGIPQNVFDKLSAAAATRGMFTGQNASTWNAQIPFAQGESAFFPLQKKVGEENIRAAYRMAGDEIPLVDYGKGVAAINFGPSALPRSELYQLQNALGATDYVPTRNVSDYIDYSSAWTQPQGSGAVTRKWLEYFNKLSPTDQAKLSQGAMAPAGDLFDIYKKTSETRGYKTREDLMNLLDFVRNKGLLAVPAALASGAAFPATLPNFGYGLLQPSDPTEERSSLF